MNLFRLFFSTLPKVKVKVETYKYSEMYGLYASNFGRIKTPSGVELKQYKLDNDRRYDYAVKHCGIWIKVYKIVTDAWLGEKPESTSIDHINGNRYDNRIENLEYVTIAEIK